MVFIQLAHATVLLLASAALVRLVFEKTERKVERQIGFGLVCGLCAMAAMVLPPAPAGLRLHTEVPLLLVAGLFGGVPGGLVALPPTLAGAFAQPLGSDAALGPPAAVAMVLLSVASGVFIRAVSAWRTGLTHRLTHRLGADVALACIAPLPLLASLAVWGAVPSLALTAHAAVVLMWIPASTLLLARITHAEATRSLADHEERQQALFERNTGHVSRGFFRNQLFHHFDLKLRYGSHFSCAVIVIDDAQQHRARFGERHLADVRQDVACAVRASVRDADICAAVADDRFIVLLSHTRLNATGVVAERIQRNVSGAAAWNARLPVTVSIGVADAAHAIAAEDVVAAAEDALAEANAQAPRSAIGPADLSLAAPVVHAADAQPAAQSAPIATPKATQQSTMPADGACASA